MGYKPRSKLMIAYTSDYISRTQGSMVIIKYCLIPEIKAMISKYHQNHSFVK